MSYRPHKRKRATTLKGKCIEYVGDNLHTVFEPRVLDLELREQVLEYLCETPNLVDLPDGELAGHRAAARSAERRQPPRPRGCRRPFCASGLLVAPGLF